MIALNEKAIRDCLRRRTKVQAAYLFGSFAKKRPRSSSDIDLAVLLHPSVPEDRYLEERLDIMTELSDRLHREVDVVILNEAGPVLLHQIYRDGRLLYETDHQAALSFKARAMIEYVDWLP